MEAHMAVIKYLSFGHCFFLDSYWGFVHGFTAFLGLSQILHLQAGQETGLPSFLGNHL
jgi:hypothetical protein